MKKIITFLVLACATSAFAETYSIIGDRYLRRYTADSATPVYNASVDAALIAEDLCKVPWAHSDVTQAVYTTHTDALLDSNIANRESFDAASFCARHTNSTHWAYANAAVYRYELPDGTLPKLTNLSVRVFSDPYQRYGARIVLLTNSTGEIPTDCATVRGNVVGSIVATNVAKRLAYSINSEIKWYPAYSNLVFSTAQLGASGLQLQKYLFVFVLKENYAYVNGNWIEGSSYIQNKIEIMTDAAIPSWTDGATVNLAVVSAPSSDDGETSDDDSSVLDEERDANDVTEATKSPWYGKMACYEDDMTVVKCTDAQTNVHYFAAPPVAYRRLHRGETNLTAVTHAAFKYGTAWALGPATNVSASSGLTIRSVYPHQAVKLLHRAARDSRGYEYLPTLVDMTNSDVRLVADYATAFGLGSSYFATVTNLAASTRIPLGWLLYSGATSAADTDGDTLDLVREWDNGIYPTNPNALDTDGDAIRDDYELAFFLKGTDAAEDFDGDGLSNYSEYLISNVFHFASCDPAKYATDGALCNYYRKVGDLYLGEIFQDHDRVDDAWERAHAESANSLVYDPDADPDGDGWSNWAEAKAGTDPGLVTSPSVDADLPEYPIPVVRMTVSYTGSKNLSGALNVRAWNEEKDAYMLSAPSAAWAASSAAKNRVRYVGKNPGGEASHCLGSGTVTPGSLKVYFRDVRCEKARLYNGVEISSVVSTDTSKWFYFIEDDHEGNLYTVGSTNSTSANVTGSYKVGSVDYATGLVTIDFAKLPAIYYTREDNGEGAPDGTDQTQGVSYNAIKVNLAESYVRLAWEPAGVVAAGNGTYYFSDATSGYLREGLASFVVWSDEDGDENYTPGEPLGFAQHVDVGWQGAAFAVTLTDMNAITPRVSPWSSATSDRSETVSESTQVYLSDRTIDTTDAGVRQILNTLTNHVARADATKDHVHVRIVRWGVNGLFAYNLGIGFADPSPIVLDRTFSQKGRDFIFEGDFLQDGEHDIDWSRCESEIIDNSGVWAGAGEVTNITYLAVLEGGSGFEHWVRGSYDTNTTIRSLMATVERRFEFAKHAPKAANVGVTCFAARPTFTWTLPDEEAVAKKYGTTYTAFKLKIFDANGTKVYDSGVRRAPAQDADGVFSWTADCSAGDLVTANGKAIEATGTYTWQVAMYNAKFQPHASDRTWYKDEPSPGATLTMAVNAQQEMNDHAYSSIDVCVKYAGPSAVLAKYQDLSTLEGKVRVQAFATADFAGEPLAENIVTTAVPDASDLTANVRLSGIPNVGTYSLRAYIDSNGNRALDAWESWGASVPVALTTDDKTVPSVTVWIEDCDLDQDWLPDVYEYAVATNVAAGLNFLTNLNPTVASTVRVNQSLYSSVASSNLTAGVSTGAGGASLTSFILPAATNVIFGVSTPTLPSVEYIRDAVRWRLSQ